MTSDPASAGGRGDRPGLQGERTRLSWERAASAAIVNGALLLLSRGRGWALPAAGALGLALALTFALVGRHRGADIARDGPQLRPARGPVLVCGCATAGFGVLVLAVLGLGAPGL